MPGIAASPVTRESMVCTASQNGESGLLPPAWSQTQAATVPPGFVTRAISRSPATGSAMKCTTNSASAVSNSPSANGRSSALATAMCTSGFSSCAAAAYPGDGSTATTDAAPRRRANSAVSAPVPHPTSIAVMPGATPAKSANGTASGRE